MPDDTAATSGIVDAHHHLWVRARHPQEWVDPVTMAAIDADFVPDDLATLLSADGVEQTVVVQTVSSEQETVELLTIAAEQPFVAGVVGWVDLTAPDLITRLERFRAGAGGRYLVGIRHVVQGETDPYFLDRPEIRRGIAALGAAGLVFDLVIRDHQLPAAARLVRDLPEVSFVLDHLAKPELAAGRTQQWERDLAEFAAHANVTAKLSGLVTEADWDAWTLDDLRPAVAHALDVFGPGRMMFGSDWPVCLLATSYHAWIDTVAELVSELDDHERAAIWRETARRVYGLGAAPSASGSER